MEGSVPEMDVGRQNILSGHMHFFFFMHSFQDTPVPRHSRMESQSRRLGRLFMSSSAGKRRKELEEREEGDVHFSLAISFFNLSSTPSSQSLLVIDPIHESSE